MKLNWYVLAPEGHTVHPELQRCLQRRMKAIMAEVAEKFDRTQASWMQGTDGREAI